MIWYRVTGDIASAFDSFWEVEAEVQAVSVDEAVAKVQSIALSGFDFTDDPDWVTFWGPLVMRYQWLDGPHVTELPPDQQLQRNNAPALFDAPYWAAVEAVAAADAWLERRHLRDAGGQLIDTLDQWLVAVQEGRL